MVMLTAPSFWMPWRVRKVNCTIYSPVIGLNLVSSSTFCFYLFLFNWDGSGSTTWEVKHDKPICLKILGFYWGLNIGIHWLTVSSSIRDLLPFNAMFNLRWTQQQIPLTIFCIYKLLLLSLLLLYICTIPSCNTIPAHDQDDLMPFPWTRTIDKTPAEKVAAENKPPKRQKVVRSTGLNLPDLQPGYDEIVVPCKSLGCIHFDLPRPGIVAGGVLKHARRVMESIFTKYWPCTYKIGFTHSPSWRWSNSLYGYKGAVDGWTNMIVFYISHERYGPAMLEAALIETHIGDLA